MKKRINMFVVVICLFLLASCAVKVNTKYKDNAKNETIVSENIEQDNNIVEYTELSEADISISNTENLSDNSREKSIEESLSNSIIQNDEIIIQNEENGDDILTKTDDLTINDNTIEKEIVNTDLIETKPSEDLSQSTKYRLITADELLEYANLSREDISYIDVDAFVNEYKVTTQVFELISAEEVRNQFIKDNEKEKKYQEWMETDFHYLTQVVSIEKPKGFSMSYCDKIALYYYHENYGKSIIIDLTKNKVYYGGGNNNPINNINNAEITVDLTDNILSDVVSRIEESNLDTLDYSYISQEDIMARNSWGIAFECEEGIVRYYVYNATGEEPSRIINCVHDLLEYAKGLAE